MFSVNNFYDYLIHKYGWPLKSQNVVYAFEEHGARDLQLLNPIFDVDEFNSKIYYKNLQFYYGAIFMFDQEPLDFTYYYANPMFRYDESNEKFSDLHISKSNHILDHLARVTTPIICHSEKNSQEVNFIKSKKFIDVHYWYHGIVARDWFRHWRHYEPFTGKANSRLGCYIRDTSGSREYRKDVLELIKQENIYCPALNGKTYTSDASATLEWGDTNKFDIHIVAETLFNTQKIHLTEKVLKPIAMEQPFIVFSGPGSLQYMRDYGFQTFDSCWDETYDTISNSQQRHDAISNLVKELNSLPDKQYNRIISRAKLIAQNNREHFYSQRFEDILLSELHSNLSKAFDKQQELLISNPGGPWFAIIDKLQKLDAVDIFKKSKHIPYIMEFLKRNNTEHYNGILKQYPDLF